ncbi:MAG: alanine racemase [Proteobacteria bacterium]|nr:alanine racemase [Pseudomonadota bacterium]
MTSVSINRVEIDLSALRENYRALRTMAGHDVAMMAIVKAEAYGHGLVEVAQTLYDEGVRAFGVAEAWEGVRLRDAGISGEILVFLGAGDAGFEDVVHFNLTPVVYDTASLAILSALSGKMQTPIGVHLKVDSGMGRIGIMPEEVLGFVEEIKGFPGIFLKGVLSHFPVADESSSERTFQQTQTFGRVVDDLRMAGYEGEAIHIANSAALIRYPQAHFNMVRPGISLYGCYPSREKEYLEALELKPVMSFKTAVQQVKTVPEGHGISYGHTFITRRPTQLAVLPVGYNNGYLRKLSNRAHVLVKGRRAPIIGRVCMNVCMIDVTDIGGVVPRDEVVLMGRQGDENITAHEIAEWMETIDYEVLCLFGNLNRREYRG